MGGLSDSYEPARLIKDFEIQEFESWSHILEFIFYFSKPINSSIIVSNNFG